MVLGRRIFWPMRVNREYAEYPDQGFSIQTNHDHSEVLWSRITKFAETPRVFVLFAPSPGSCAPGQSAFSETVGSEEFWELRGGGSSFTERGTQGL